MNDKPMEPLAAFTVRTCRGTASCPHAVLAFDPSSEIARVVSNSGWTGFLTARFHPLRHHHQFRIAVAACPNGCSQPHIADFALVATTSVLLDTEGCAGCGTCVAACAEDALCLDDAIRINRNACLGCAACIRVCPTGALRRSPDGYRVLVGGKLGRHPRLAHEFGVFSLPKALHVLERVLSVLMSHQHGRERLGDVVDRLGKDHFDTLVRP